MPKVKTKKQEATVEAPQETGLAARVDKLEQEVRELKELLKARAEPGPDDWKKSIGIFKDDPTFDEVVKLGAAYRRRQPKC